MISLRSELWSRDWKGQITNHLPLRELDKKKKKEEEEGREKETQRLLFLETTRLVFHQEYYHRYDEAIQVSSEIVDRRYIHRIPVSGKYYEIYYEKY